MVDIAQIDEFIETVINEHRERRDRHLERSGDPRVGYEQRREAIMRAADAAKSLHGLRQLKDLVKRFGKEGER